MAQAAVEPAVSGGAFIGRPAEVPRMKRKTPSELRDEQLKRRVSEKVADDQSFPSAAFDRPSTGLRNPEQQKTSKYISTRVTGVFPVKKSRNAGKENCKDALPNNEKAPKSADTVTASQSAESPFPCGDGNSAQLDSSVPSLAEAAKPGFRKAEKCSKNALRSVLELHIGEEKQAGSSKFDMDKVMKGFGARGASGASSGTNIQAGDVPLKSSEVCPSKITIPGKRAPLDLTLKTTLQFVSSSSVKWCHNLSTSCKGSVAGPIAQSFNGRSQSSGRTRQESNKEVLFSKALQSWVYPQSMLPAPIVSAMLASTAQGGLGRFFSESLLHVPEESVEYLLCGNCLEKQSCNAYLSQSTRGMRSLLRKQGIQLLHPNPSRVDFKLCTGLKHRCHLRSLKGVCFSMPLCKAEVEQATEDDLIEFSKIRTLNLGQTLHVDALSEVDNTTQSLLSFTGNKSVHGLYDVLLNYKSFLNSLSATDVPALYSPVPFQNGCLHVPEVICREMRKADSGLASSSVSDDAGEAGPAASDPPPLAAGSMCYSMEIKDAALPPWVVSGVCAAMASDTDCFDLTIATEPSSAGLNAALASLGLDARSKKTAAPSEGGCEALGVPGAVLVPSLRSAALRGLRYERGEYLARTAA